MSERDENQSASQVLRELSAKVEGLGGKVETWEETLAARPPAVAERVAGALRTAQEQNETKDQERAAVAEERGRELARRLLEAENARAQEIQSQRQSLTGVTESLERVSRGVEGAIAPWVLGWSRGLWRVVAMNVALTVGVFLALSIILLPLFWWAGPPARDRAALAACEASLTDYKGAWNAMTEAEQQENNRRRQSQEPGQ